MMAQTSVQDISKDYGGKGNAAYHHHHHHHHHVHQDIATTNEESDLEGPSPWIEWFLSQPEHQYFVEIEEEYLLDRFNLTGLPLAVQHFQRALDRITLDSEEVESFLESASWSESDASSMSGDGESDVENASLSSRHSAITMNMSSKSGGSEDGENSSLRRKNALQDAHRLKRQIHTSSLHLYGLIHARYITTSSGMARMYAKWKEKAFGCCPRVFCRGFALLPVGLSDVPEKSYVVLYCGSCDDIYRPKSSRFHHIDGAYFGTSFPHLFFQQYKNTRPQVKHTDYYVPKIFGFKLYTSSVNNGDTKTLSSDEIPQN